MTNQNCDVPRLFRLPIAPRLAPLQRVFTLLNAHSQSHLTVPTPTLMPTLSANPWCPRRSQRPRPVPPHGAHAHLNAHAQRHLTVPTPASTPTPSATSWCPRPPQRPRSAPPHGAVARVSSRCMPILNSCNRVLAAPTARVQFVLLGSSNSRKSENSPSNNHCVHI